MKVTSNCEYIIDSLANHEWSDRVKPNGDKIQKRDAGIHGSDVARYLQLSPIRASEQPKLTLPGHFSFNDILEMEQKELVGMSLQEWRRYHAA
jgi:hypothetical protein